jgi:chromosome segregation ATPase
MRFKDLQQDAQTARDEIADLLGQRAQWIEEKASLEQTIGDFSDKIDERDTQLIERDNVIRNKDALLSEANKNSQELLRLSTKQHDEHVEVKNRYKMLQEVEQQLRDKVERVEAQLKEEVYKNGILQRAALSRSSDAAAGSIGQRGAPDDSIVDDGVVMLLRAPAIDDDAEVPKRAVAAPEESITETAHVRRYG